MPDGVADEEESPSKSNETNREEVLITPASGEELIKVKNKQGADTSEIIKEEPDILESTSKETSENISSSSSLSKDEDKEEDKEDTCLVDDTGSETTEESVPNSPVRTKLRRKIMVVGQICCLLLSVFVTVYSSSWDITSKGSPLILGASPFFPRHSLISDFYTGDVGALTERLLGSDLTLVVYYAPWDRDSQLLRWEVEKVARYYHEQILFAAINCWHPKSECRVKYKIRTFPAIILHVRSATGLETRAMAYGGPKDAGHIIRFLSKALRPLSHVTNHADLARLQLEHSAVVLGFYDFKSLSHIPKGFYSFYLASLRAIQHDNINSVAWGVVTNDQTARALSFNATQSIHIVLWNTTLVYTSASKAKSEDITNWVFKRFHETATWIEVTGSKSLALNKMLVEGPSLIIFTPDNPYYAINDPFMLLREVSLDYNNCENSTRVTNLGNYLGSMRSRGRGHLRQTERLCKSYLKEQLSVYHLSRQQFDFKDESCCHTMSASDLKKNPAKAPTFVENKVCDVCIHSVDKPDNFENIACSSPNSWEEESNLLQHASRLMGVFTDSCREVMLQYNPWQHYSVCCQRNTSKEKFSVSSTSDADKILPDNNFAEGGLKDDHVERLVSISGEDQCKKLFHGSLLAAPTFLKENYPAPSLTGLGCKTNKSLAFVAIDSLQHKDIAERLGVNMTAKDPPKTAAIIVDLDREMHFVMDASLSKPTLVNFILNYTNGLLDRKLISNKEIENECQPGHMCIQELNSDNYMDVTQAPGKMVVVLHYSKTCVACTSIGHVFLNIAHAAQHLPNVTFARIDALTNILPWHLYFESLPTIIVHPHFRKSESRIFDLNRPLTPANLLSFIVANLDEGHRLALALSMCKEACEERVIQAARVTTTQYHHELSSLTMRLQQIIEYLAKFSIDSSNSLSSYDESYYHILKLTKSHLVNHIRKIRIKLTHLGQVNSLFNIELDKPVTAYSDLLKSLHYIRNRESATSSSRQDHITLHDEL